MSSRGASHEGEELGEWGTDEESGFMDLGSPDEGFRTGRRHPTAMARRRIGREPVARAEPSRELWEEEKER